MTDVKSLVKQPKETVLYHGSSNKFGKFDNDKAGSNEGSIFGKGAYLTDSKSVARHYAQAAVKRESATGWKEGSFGQQEATGYKATTNTGKVNTFSTRGSFFDTKKDKIDNNLKEHISKTYSKEYNTSNQDSRKEIDRLHNYSKTNSSSIKGYKGELHYLVTHLAPGNEKVLTAIKDNLSKRGHVGIKYPSDEHYEGGGHNNYYVFNHKTLKQK